MNESSDLKIIAKLDQIKYAITSGNSSVLGRFPNTDYLSGMIEAPLVKTYTFDTAAIDARTLDTFVVYTLSGTCTASVQINGASVTGMSSMAITSTSTEFTATAANTVAIGDVITFVVSAISAPVDLVFRLKYTRI